MKKASVFVLALLAAALLCSCAKPEEREAAKSFKNGFEAFPYYDCGAELISCEYGENTMTRVYSPAGKEQPGDYTELLREWGFDGEHSLYYKEEGENRYYLTIDSYELDGELKMTWYVYAGAPEQEEPTLDSIKQ